MKIKRLIKFAIVLMMGFISFGFVKDSFALNKIITTTKAAYEGVYKCIQNGAYNKEWMASDFDKEGKGFFANGVTSLDLVKMPYGFSHAEDNSINCKQIMIGYGTFSRDEERGFIPDSSRNGTLPSDVAGYFDDIGYSATPIKQIGPDSEQQSFSFTAACNNGLDNTIMITNLNRDIVGTTDAIRFPTITKKSTGGGWFVDNTIASNKDINVPTDGGVLNYKVCNEWIIIGDNSRSSGTSGIQYYIDGDAGQLFIVADDGSYYGSDTWTFFDGGGKIVGNKETKKISGEEIDDYSDYTMKWKNIPMDMIKGIDAGNQAGYGLSSVSDSYDSLAFTNQEIYDLYTYYAKDVYHISVLCEGESGFDENGKPINWVKDKKCVYVLGEGAVTTTTFPVYGVNSAKHFGEQINGPDDLVAKLNQLDLTDVTTLQGGDGSQSFDEDEDACYANSGKIGWIICPIINGIAGVGKWLWEEVEANFLQIKPGDLFRSGSGVNEAWKIFRDIANTIFIIFFLFVIFSQLTGVGIDNYGIKKILPKLIVVAILINLSFLLCAFAVDLSNILGVGLNNMFSSMANLVTVPVQNYTPGQPLVSFGLGAAGAGAGLTLFALFANPVGAISFLTIAAAIGLTVLGIVISLVISILFMYLVLMVRYAGIVILIAVAPVAIVCYMLPNTEQIWKKWLNLLKSLLMVYPICGALIGAGRLAGHILASTGTTSMVIAGMIVEVVPFFLVPMLLKQSLALAGNIGAKLMSMGKSTGRGLSKTARGAVTSSPRFKDFSKLEQSRSEANRAQRIQDKLKAKKERLAKNGGTLSERDNERLLKATETTNAYQQRKAQGKAGAFELSEDLAFTRAQSTKRAQELKSYSDQYSTLTRSAMGTELHNAVAAYKSNRSAENATRLQAAISASEGRGMNKEMLSELGGLELSASNAQDAEILNQYASSNNKVIGQFGRQMSKPGNTSEHLTMDQFAGSTGGVKLSEALANQGPAALNGADEDTLEYIKDNGISAATNDMLVNAATNTTNQKELRQINEMFTKTDSEKINFSGDSLAKMDKTTVDTLRRMVKPGSRLETQFINASNDISGSPEALKSLHPEVRAIINDVRKNSGKGLGDI